MNLFDYLTSLYRYDDWANREALASLEATSSAPERALKVMAHIPATQWVWMSRLKRVPQPCPVWPDWTLQECAAQLGSLRAAWQEYFAAIGSDGLQSQIAYANTKGDKFTNSIADILMHVAMHGTYHRGQIAAAVRAAGGTPAYTDFIHAVRTGKVHA